MTDDPSCYRALVMLPDGRTRTAVVLAGDELEAATIARRIYPPGSHVVDVTWLHRYAAVHGWHRLERP